MHRSCTKCIEDGITNFVQRKTPQKKLEELVGFSSDGAITESYRCDEICKGQLWWAMELQGLAWHPGQVFALEQTELSETPCFVVNKLGNLGWLGSALLFTQLTLEIPIIFTLGIFKGSANNFPSLPYKFKLIERAEIRWIPKSHSILIKLYSKTWMLRNDGLLVLVPQL